MLAPMEEVSRPGQDSEARRQRLHGLAGVYGLGVFLVGHLAVQASALGGASRYAATLGAIRPWMSAIVDLFVLSALAVHVTLGARLLRSAPPDARIERYGDHRLWVAQRMSAGVVLVFLVVHLAELRLQRLFFGVDASAMHTVLAARLSSTWAGVPWRALVYVIGVGAAAFHFQSGLSAAIARGRRAVTIGLGILLFVVGTVTVVGVATGTRLLAPAEAGSAPCGAPVERAPFAAPSR
jgi:succinate dehydrogenase / fumarate reductase cytochrome b subunit